MSENSPPSPQTHRMILMPSGRQGDVPPGTTVLEAARSLGVEIESICGGRQTCGKCLIMLERGTFAEHGITSLDDHLTPPGEAERHRIARPYKKNEQAFIECFNGTLRREEFGRTPFKGSDQPLAQQRASGYLDYYHNKRPHLALDMMTPTQFAVSHLR